MEQAFSWPIWTRQGRLVIPDNWNLLKNRGMIVEDNALALSCLQHANYFFLNWHVFMEIEPILK